jgi:hypothetical protein
MSAATLDHPASPADARLQAGAGAETLPRYVRWSIVAALLSVTILTRGGISIGEYTVNLAMPILYFMIVKGWMEGDVRLDTAGLLMFSLAMCVGGLSFLANIDVANRQPASLTSLMLLGTLYLPFVFRLKPMRNSHALWLWTMRLLLNVALISAVVGILQFYAQFVFKAPWLFNISLLLPDFMRGSGVFNSAIPVGSLFKANGIFFREPSGFSFMMAFAIICELALFRRMKRVGVYAFALVLSYSGTGLLALAVGLIFPFGFKTAMRILAIAVVGLLVFLLAGDALNLSFTLNRIGEFGAETSSGYIRYIAPGRLIVEQVDSAVWSAFIGHGPGTIFKASTYYDFHDPTWAKLLYEYGLFGFTAVGVMMVLVLRRSKAPVQIPIMLFFYWLAQGGHLLSPECVFLIYILFGLWPRPVVEDTKNPSAELPSGSAHRPPPSFRPAGAL